MNAYNINKYSLGHQTGIAQIMFKMFDERFTVSLINRCVYQKDECY